MTRWLAQSGTSTSAMNTPRHRGGTTRAMTKANGMAMSRQSSVTIAAMSRSWPTDLTEAQRPCVVSNARGRVVVSSEPDWVVGDLVRGFALEAWLGETRRGRWGLPPPRVTQRDGRSTRVRSCRAVSSGPRSSRVTSTFSYINMDGDALVGPKDPDDGIAVPFRAGPGTSGVVDIQRLEQILRTNPKTKSATGADDGLDAAEYALQLIRFPYRQVFGADEGITLAKAFRATIAYQEHVSTTFRFGGNP